jgi:peptidoglycan/LPS O-acetylase OafA/YrhL
MHTLRNITISVRSQAAIILALTAFWCLSFLGCLSEIDSPHLFWGAVLVFLPFVIPIFTIIMFVSYRRTGRQHSRWVCAAILAAVSCWVVILGYISLGWYL